AAADLAQEFLDDVVMRLRPVPAGAEAPAVDDIADQIDRVSLDMAQHIQDKVGLAAARSQVQIREEKRPVTVGLVGLGQWAASSRGGEQTRTLCTDSRVASMTRRTRSAYNCRAWECRERGVRHGSWNHRPQGDRLRVEQGPGPRLRMGAGGSGMRNRPQWPRCGGPCPNRARAARGGGRQGWRNPRRSRRPGDARGADLRLPRRR